MPQILLITIGGGVGFFVAWFWYKGKIKEIEKEIKKMQKEMEKEREMLNGFDEFNKKVAELKKGRKEKIVEELKKQEKIQTNRVADLLDISKVTAFRYLDELEKEGVIEQVGALGRNVEYKMKVK